MMTLILRALPAGGQDDPFQILIVLVWGHRLLYAKHFIGAAMVHDIYKNENIMAANRLVDDRAAFTRGKTLGVRLDAVITAEITGLDSGIPGSSLNRLGAPLDEVPVDLVGEIQAARKGDKPDRADGIQQPTAFFLVKAISQLVCFRGCGHRNPPKAVIE
jgi:hypothetical protein